jgi:hypothetical protein
VVKSAQRTLTIIIALLIALLAGIAYLSRAYHIGAAPPGPGYQSVLSQLTAAVFGRNVFYFVTIGSILIVLSLSANTAFADFPRLCRLIAQDGYLPNPFAVRGRRLVYTWGITVLAFLCAMLLIAFGGVTDRLIPLFAIGAFLAFTLSQAGMVAHWRRTKGPHSRLAMLINGVGAVATASTVVIVTITKFKAGAWITTLVIPGLIALMFSIRRHYDRVAQDIADAPPLDFRRLRAPVVIMPMFTWNEVVRRALEFALTVSSDIHVLHVHTEDEEKEFHTYWKAHVDEPIRRAGLPAPHVQILASPYRFVITPIVDYVLDLEKKLPERQIAVIVPELVERHWYLYFLHNQRATWLKAALLRRGNKRIVIIDVPWYLK